MIQSRADIVSIFKCRLKVIKNDNVSADNVSFFKNRLKFIKKMTISRPTLINTFYGTLRIFFRIINDFVHRFILDCTFVDFTVSLLILPFYIVNSNSKMVKSTVKP
jgi:hypothetical protein